MRLEQSFEESPLRILLASPREQELQAWRKLLCAQRQRCWVAGTVQRTADLQEAIDRLCPHLVLLAVSFAAEDDGLHALDAIRQQGYQVGAIAVGGQKNYRTACMALRCGADDLLAKPLTAKKMEGALARIRKRRTRTAAPVQEHTQWVSSLFFERAKNVPPEKQLSEDLVNLLYGTHFYMGAYRMATICLETQNGGVSSKTGALLQQYTLSLREKLSALCREQLYHLDVPRVRLLLNYQPGSGEAVLAVLRAALAEAPAHLPPGTSLTVCCSREHRQIREIHLMLDEASDMVWHHFSGQQGRLLINGQGEACPEHLKQLYWATEQKLKRACSLLDLETFQTTLQEFFALPDEIVGRCEVRSLIRSVERYMLKVNHDLIEIFADEKLVGNAIVRSLRTVTTLQEYKRCYEEQLVGLLARVAALPEGKISRPVRMAQYYIDENYAHSLTLQIVSTAVGVSPTYLSALFKKDIHCNFSDYIRLCRIENAKKLLRESDKKILAVAQAVGFSSPRYFSQVFRKQEGINPTEYRATQRLQAG